VANLPTAKPTEENSLTPLAGPKKKTIRTENHIAATCTKVSHSTKQESDRKKATTRLFAEAEEISDKYKRD